MKVLSAVTAISLGIASANPFAPKMTRNTPKSSYIGSLMDKARPTPNSQLGRRLDGEDQEIDISSYSIKFEQCQYIKQYAEEYDEETDSILETKRFVIFRLCPDSSCSSCNYNYGEYIVDMETYLQSTLQHKQEEQENYCQACEECEEEEAANDDAAAANDDGNRRRSLAILKRRSLYNVDCSSCYTQCQNIENMEENGYVDASEYIECEKVYENENTGVVYYAGAICGNSGTRIKVGMFTDEECNVHDGDASVDQYLKNENGYNVKLSYHLLKQTFVANECVASCTKVDENANEDNDDDAAQEDAEVETAEVCENLYEAAGKCENPHGFESGMDYSYSDYYDIQVANEETVCDYITTIQAGHFDETGEVVISGGQTTILGNSVQTTGGQKFALTFFVIGTVGLAAYAALLHRKLTKDSKADLADQGDGAMA
mmetsp:Transcript_12168/g.29722  ORF Transcript_12168/g.29722 Transcript_12168/m.29722 type:complete len:432 (+) Transcript_12168:161-1456(+)